MNVDPNQADSILERTELLERNRELRAENEKLKVMLNRFSLGLGTLTGELTLGYSWISRELMLTKLGELAQILYEGKEQGK